MHIVIKFNNKNIIFNDKKCLLFENQLYCYDYRLKIVETKNYKFKCKRIF